MPNLVLLFGGQSAEHEISVRSAISVFCAVNLTRYELTLVRINLNGEWVRLSSNTSTDRFQDPGEPVFLNADGKLISEERPHESVQVDVVFPLLHGANGEDGAIHGLLQMYGIPCVGPGILGSSVCMDKDVSKRLLRDAGIPIPNFRVLRNREANVPSYDFLTQELGRVLFVKPANTGSSVGISRVESLAEFQPAIELAFRYDEKVIVEEAIAGREIECSVLGRNPIQVSACGEIRTAAKFYSYHAKYEEESLTELIIPAPLSESLEIHIKDLACRVCTVLECRGMARVDFFLDERDRVVVNEVNTIPGFTSISMYPLLWEYSGVSFSDLVDALIEDALTSHERRRNLVLKRT